MTRKDDLAEAVAYGDLDRVQNIINDIVQDRLDRERSRPCRCKRDQIHQFSERNTP